MRKWGIVISVFYAVVVIGLLLPGLDDTGVFVGFHPEEVLWLFKGKDYWVFWSRFIWALMLIGGQVVLLCVSVDSSWRRLKPRKHLSATIAVISMLVALLSFSVIWSLAAVIIGDKAIVEDKFTDVYLVGGWLGLWAIWGIVFHAYRREKPAILVKSISWLLRGSILELLIVVPAHIVVRQRNDCSAPVATGFGIATGIAIMLMCFGPSVLSLYKKRLDIYHKRELRT